MRKLILKCGLSPGDIVMLTAAVRDLHRCCPQEFLTDVRTSCPQLWENNPHLFPLTEDDPAVEIIDCAYPLIDRCNESSDHCLQGFISFLQERLNRPIKLTEPRGDIHLSPQERAWYSQVHEQTGADTPFWIVAAGGKYDVTIKWWDTARYQQVVNGFRGRVLFVQVGDWEHHHPKLEGVIDLRGQTSLRELVRLVYHAQGVLCSVTALMHLAAAVPAKSGQAPRRPCVVVAGGREPTTWEAYPNHQFIHTIGALSCCAHGGCWKDRLAPLGDGDRRDEPDHLCANPAGQLPRCMDLITADEVVRRMELYFSGGAAAYLQPSQFKAAQRGISATRKNDYDDQPLTLPSARAALEDAIASLPPCPDGFRGRGIVICGGGLTYFTNAWVCIQMLRHLGCSLPIELWHLGEDEFDARMEELVSPLGVRCVDATSFRKQQPVRRLGGWELKPYALLFSAFQEALFLDADNLPVRNPEFLFATEEYRRTGALFWPDYGQFEKSAPIWISTGVPRPEGPEFESGQMLVDKPRCWRALRLALWFNEQADFYYRHLHGDKETFHLAFRKLGLPFFLVPHPIHRLSRTMCQHDPGGRRLFQHRNLAKWSLQVNPTIPGFWHEDLCRGFIDELRHRWDGRLSRFLPAQRQTRPRRGDLTIAAVMITCPERRRTHLATLRSLAESDWADRPVTVHVHHRRLDCRQDHQTQAARAALARGLRERTRYILFLEDDLAFNQHLLHNLQNWWPLRNSHVRLASLYNPGVRFRACDPSQATAAAATESVFGSQALLLSRETAAFVLRHWNDVEGMQDIRISRLAARLGGILYHTPSLVQHTGKKSTWGGTFHQAIDFDPHWQAEAL